MKRYPSGFTLITAVSLLLVLAVSATFLGRVLTQIKSTKLKTVARVSSLGFEDSMTIVMVSNVIQQIAGSCTGDAASLNQRDTKIPGTQVSLNVDSITPSLITDATGTLIIKTTLTLPPDVPRGVSEQFIDNPGKVTFRLEFLNKDMAQNQKIFDSPISCFSFRGLIREKRQVKIAYSITWSYRGKNLARSGTRLFNLQEIGL